MSCPWLLSVLITALGTINCPRLCSIAGLDDYTNAQFTMTNKTEYVKDFLGWQIYVIQEAYLMTPANQLISRYIAIQPEKHHIINDVTIGSLEAGIIESER